jgi:hypothetical protein
MSMKLQIRSSKERERERERDETFESNSKLNPQWRQCDGDVAAGAAAITSSRDRRRLSVSFRVSRNGGNLSRIIDAF